MKWQHRFINGRKSSHLHLILQCLGNAAFAVNSHLIPGPPSTAWPPTMSSLITGTGAESAALRPHKTYSSPQERLWCGGPGPYSRAPGSLRPRAILIRWVLVRALIVLALTLCPVYHWTSQWRAPSLGEGTGEAERGLVGRGGSRLSGLYRAPIKGSLSERLRGRKKGMFILQPGDGLSQGKEWTARGEGCLPVKPGMNS